MKPNALIATGLFMSALLAPTLYAAPTGAPADPEVATGAAKAPKAIKEKILKLESDSPKKVFITVVNDDEETSFTLKGDEIFDEALIDNKMSALDNETRAEILATLKSIRDGKLKTLSDKNRAELSSLKLELSAREAEMEARTDELSARAEEMAKLGESISQIVMSSVQQIDLDKDGSRVMVIHADGVDEASFGLHHISIDKQDMHFKILKEMLSDSELSQEQKAQLQQMLEN